MPATTNHKQEKFGDFDYCPSLRNLLEAGTVTGATGRVFPSIDACSTVNNLRILRAIIRRHEVQRSLEIGLAFGGSALAILATMAEVSPDNYAHTAIDPFQSTVWDSSAVQMIRNAGLQSSFSLIESPSSLALSQLCAQGSKFDLIYIDGSHLFEDVFVDMYFACQLLRQGGFVAFDDCTDRHIAKVLRFVARNYNEILEEIGTNQYLANITLKRRIAGWTGRTQLRLFSRTTQSRREWDAAFVHF